MKTSNTLSNVQHTQTIEQLEQLSLASLVNIYNDYADSNSYERIYENDDYGINEACLGSNHDAILAAVYGDYNPSHDYFYLDGKANLKSFDTINDTNCIIYFDDLAQWIVDNDLFDEYDIEVTTLDGMLASIEDNISDASLLSLSLMMDKLSLDLSDGDTAEMNGYKDLEEYYIETLIDEISDYDYNQLNDIIDMLSINYK